MEEIKKNTVQEEKTSVEKLEKYLNLNFMMIERRLDELEEDKKKKYQFARKATKFLCDNYESVFLIAVLVIANLYIWSHFE